MRRITLLFVLFAYLSSVTEAHELLKAANLFAHYMQHREQDQALSFADFLEMHYSDSSAHACASEHKNQLPFKSHHASAAMLNFVAIIPSLEFASIQLWGNEAGTPASYYRPLAASSRVSAIWQPPKTAC